MPNEQTVTVVKFPTDTGRQARIGDAIIVNVGDGVVVPGEIDGVDDNGITAWSAQSRPDIIGGSLDFDPDATGEADLGEWLWIFNPTALTRTPADYVFGVDVALGYHGDGLRLLPSTTGLAVYGITGGAVVPDWTEVALTNATNSPVTLKHNDGRASAGDQLTMASGADHNIGPDELLWVMHVTTSAAGGPRWLVDDAGQ